MKAVTIGTGIDIGTGITITGGVNPPPIGTRLAWTNNTYFNMGPNAQQSGITTTTLGDGNFAPSVLMYAWESIQLSPTGSTNVLGYNCYSAVFAGQTISGIVSQATAPNSWSWTGGSVQFGSNGSLPALTAGGFYQAQNVSAPQTIAANTYFILSPSAVSLTYYTLNQNITICVNNNPYVTMVNTLWQAPQGQYPNPVPTQIGGTGAGYTEYSNTGIVISVLFKF